MVALAIAEKFASTCTSLATPIGHITLVLHIVTVSQESPEAMLLYGLYLFTFAEEELVCSSLANPIAF